MGLQEKKLEQRSLLKQKRREFCKTHDLEKVSSLIADHLNDLLEPKSEFIASYIPLKEEASTEKLSNLRPKIRWAYPKVEGEELVFYYVKDKKRHMKKGAFEILEPDPMYCEKIQIQKCDSVFVPGLGFDHKAYRIGYGRGFYDRALKNYEGLKIGICFDIQMCKEDLPIEDHDLPMNHIVNERYILSPVV